MPTNTELIHEMSLDIAVIKETVTRLDKAVMGNGKPGLVDRVTVIENRHVNEDGNLAKVQKRKEVFSARTWAVILIFITQFIGLVFLFIRTGSIK